MDLAEKNSRYMSEVELQKIAAEKKINVEKAAYYPTLDAQAIGPAGFPGSTNAVGVGGLMGSPYRDGPAAGLLAQQLIYDFGQTKHAVQEAKYNAQYSLENEKVTAYQVKQFALDTYYDCANFKTQRNVWKNLKKKSAMITKEADHFVKTGQRSVVDGYLSEAQTEQADTAVAFYNARMNEAIRELSIIMGVQTNSFSCPTLNSQLSKALQTQKSIDASAIILRAVAKSNAEKEKLARDKAEYYPKILLEASVGGMESARLVPQQNYAVGVGLDVPIFNMGVHTKIKREEALLIAQQDEISAREQSIQEMNQKYDETINASKVRLQYLAKELNLANKAFSTAEKRYFSLEGTLIDLREALNNLSRTQTEIHNTQARMLKATGDKALLNGT